MARPIQLGLLGLCLVLSASLADAAPVALRMENGAFQVAGWQPGNEPSGGWASVFAIYSGPGDVPPMLGTYAVEGGALTFHPRWPLGNGMRLRAVFHPAGGPAVEATFETAVRPAAAASTRVEHVYPSTESLPSNQLKFYFYFSAPMGRGEAWRHIHLIDEKGAAVELPFLEIDQELWDRDNRRLTVLFDPGRIKRGLLPLEESGPNMQEGKRYTLVIDRDWPDAAGTPLAGEFRKPIQVVGADRTPVDPQLWRVQAPEAGGAEPLVVKFPKPLDYALLQRMIQVHDAAGALIGKVEVGAGETEWQFTPDQPWKPGAYRLVVDAALEDLAGNHVGRAFDVDTFDRVSPQLQTDTVSLPFRIGEVRLLR